MPGPTTRRVVTGHDAAGKSIVTKDSRIVGERGTLVWTTDQFPADNLDPADGGDREIGIAVKGGTVCWILEIPGGRHSSQTPPLMHRTNTVDYVIVLAGEIDLVLDGDEPVHLAPGDVVVQRGTNHAWVNRRAEPCRLLAVLIDAKALEVGGRVLEAIE